MLRLTGATLCGLVFCFGWPDFITRAFVQFGRLLLLRSGHDWDRAFYLARRMEHQIMRRIDDDWQIALLLAVVAVAALGGGAVAGHLARRHDYKSAAFVCLVSGSYLVYWYVDHDGRKHLLFALCLLAGAACVFLGCFAARFLRTRIRWP
jgi:MFS family permease